jgi:hypothetical protein
MRTVLYAAACFVALVATTMPGTSQAPTASPPPPWTETPSDASSPPSSAAKGVGKNKPATPVGPNIAGNWSGELNQVGSTTPYKFELSITAKEAETKYPGLDCVGKLRRVGQSKSYAFFVETITKGQADKGGRCPDGTITVARQGDNLALSWFGSIQGNSIVAHGVLVKK